MAFVKGKSGNPSGRPKKLLPDGRSLADLAKGYTEQAINALVEVLTEEGAPHAARITAATALLDRGWGRPAQSLEISGDEENPLRHVMRVELVPLDDSAN